MSAGSFWPSPSSVAIQGCRAREHAGHDGRALPAAPLVAHDAQLRHSPAQVPKLRRRRVVAAVVDVDDLEGGKRCEGGGDLVHERRDVAGLVPDGNDDGQPAVEGGMGHRDVTDPGR